MGPRAPRGPPPHLIRPPTIRLNSSIPVTENSFPPNDHLTKEQLPNTHHQPPKVSKISCEPAEDIESRGGQNRVSASPSVKHPLVNVKE